MKVGYLGAGAWGFCLANLLADKGYEVVLWTENATLAHILSQGKHHPKLHYKAAKNLCITTDLKKTLEGADFIVESVTSQGIRPVLTKAIATGACHAPLVITSKGIEQKTGFLLSEVAVDVLGEEYKKKIGCISGPSLAHEVMQKLPTSVVCSSYDYNYMMAIQELFSTPFFRIYPNSDIAGISFGGAMKNPIAIACAISDGLGFGDNTKAALMTRGLHEMRKLSIVKGCLPETLNGLAGLGDLCVTCLSPFSRNYIFGKLLAKGIKPERAKEKVGMVVEGVYTSLSALELSTKANIPIPITEAVYRIVYKGLDTKKAVELLLTRTVKEEHL